MVAFRPFVAADVLAIQMQRRQWREAGLERATLTIEEGRDLEERGEAWTAIGDDGRILCCSGFRETFPGRQGVAWALFAEDIGIRSWGAITRFARARLIESPLRRIEAIVRVEGGAECRWAQAIGMDAAHLLQCFGADSEPHMLFERIRP